MVAGCGSGWFLSQTHSWPAAGVRQMVSWFFWKESWFLYRIEHYQAAASSSFTYFHKTHSLGVLERQRFYGKVMLTPLPTYGHTWKQKYSWSRAAPGKSSPRPGSAGKFCILIPGSYLRFLDRVCLQICCKKIIHSILCRHYMCSSD